MHALIQDANVPVTNEQLPGGADPRGQHGCREGILRALQYGLMNGGPAAVPTLLSLIQSADLSTGHGANIAKRALHALGEAAEQPTSDIVAAVGEVVHATRATIDGYLEQLAQQGTSFPELFDPSTELDEDKEGDGFNTLNRLKGFGGAGVIQQEPGDMYGAELHYLAATAQQCLGALAESAVEKGDAVTASAIADLFVEAINLPEDGWMFEARQGCASRECAAQGLIKLTSTGSFQPSGTLVNPAGNTGQTAAVFVPAFVAEAKRRVVSAGGAATAVQSNTMAAMEKGLASANGDLDAGLASFAEGEQLYQTDAFVDAAGW